jgi:hypothetical protein
MHYIPIILAYAYTTVTVSPCRYYYVRELRYPILFLSLDSTSTTLPTSKPLLEHKLLQHRTSREFRIKQDATDLRISTFP